MEVQHRSDFEPMRVSLGDNLHKLPMQPAEKPKRVSKAMRALLESTVAEAENLAYARGYVEGREPAWRALLVGLIGGGFSGFLVGLLVHGVATLAK